MRYSPTRPAATTALALFVALGLLAAPASAAIAAPASTSGGGSDGGDVGVDVVFVPTGNSTLAAESDLASGQNGGDGGIECHGSPADHECDKTGNLSAGPTSVDYDGQNRAHVVNRTGGGGDRVTVSGGGQSATVGFHCDLNTSVSPESCSTEPSSPPGGAPGLP